MADPNVPLPNDPLQNAQGISETDRNEILAQIEDVAGKNRMNASPELFTVHAKKKGIMVPLAVNLGALVVLGLGLLILFFVFQQSAASLVQNQVVLQTTEGKLIEELKKESESKLLAKDQQIADIQKQMASLDQERNDLRTNMDSKIAAKENELKQQMQTAIEQERKRLAAQGFSQAVIEEKLKEFERKKNLEYEQQLDAFRKKADNERAELENNLKRQQADYQKSLSDLGSERQRILEDSKKKQSELQAQLDEKSKDLETQQNQARAQIAQAQKELSQLNEMRALTDSVENQLLGLYTKTSQAIQSRLYPEAQVQVKALIAYLNDDKIRAIPGIQKRREADLFMANTLADLLTQEQKRLETEAARLTTTQSTVETVQTYASQAEQAIVTGKDDQAAELYKKALTQIPEVLNAHEYFLNKALKAEQQKQTALKDALRDGDFAFSRGSFQEALAAYRTALDYLPVSASQRDSLAEKFGRAAFESETTTRQTKLDEQLAADLRTAEDYLKTGRAAEAFSAYTALVEKNPLGKTGFTAIAGLKQASIQLQGPSETQKALEAELAQVKAEKLTLTEELSALKLAAAQPKPTASPVATTTPSANGADPAELKKAKEEIERLAAIVKEYEQAKVKYAEFVKLDDPIWTKTVDSGSVLQSRLLLDSFLTSKEVVGGFPGLSDKVGRYDKANREAGQKETMKSITDVVGNLSKLKTTTERKAYLKTVTRRYANDEGMSSFLATLSKMF